VIRRKPLFLSAFYPGIGIFSERPFPNRPVIVITTPFNLISGCRRTPEKIPEKIQFCNVDFPV
jgi:hypothetical protein